MLRAWVHATLVAWSSGQGPGLGARYLLGYLLQFLRGGRCRCIAAPQMLAACRLTSRKPSNRRQRAHQGRGHVIFVIHEFAHCVRSTVQSTADPTDPLLVALRAQGALQPHRWCNGTAYPMEPLDAAPALAPNVCDNVLRSSCCRLCCGYCRLLRSTPACHLEPSRLLISALSLPIQFSLLMTPLAICWAP